jgi:hypothetical protein
MYATTPTTIRENPVRFRVRSAGPPPPSAFAAPGFVTLCVEYVAREGATRRARFNIPQVWYLPYRDMVQRAIASQQVHWVAWDTSRLPDCVPPSDDTAVLRLLAAVGAGHVVLPANRERHAASA